MREKGAVKLQVVGTKGAEQAFLALRNLKQIPCLRLLMNGLGPSAFFAPKNGGFSKFGISKFPGGPHFQGPTVSLGGEEDLHERTYYGS